MDIKFTCEDEPVETILEQPQGLSTTFVCKEGPTDATWDDTLVEQLLKGLQLYGGGYLQLYQGGTLELYDE